MPRSSSKKIQTRIYHIMLRGLDKKGIIIGDKDNEKFIENAIKETGETSPRLNEKENT